MHLDFLYIPLFIVYFFLQKVDGLPINLDHTDGIVVRSVPSGSTVVLKCLSNDWNHNFQYWHLLNTGIIIGPANDKYDPAKYRFGILSGNLTIKAVSKQEEGIYECVSRAVNGEDMNIRMVRMIVQHDWEDVYEHDNNINIIRILIALITLVLLSMGAWFVYRVWRDRYRYPRYLEPEEDEDDDESTEELFTAPSTSKASVNHQNIVPGKTTKSNEEAAFDDIDISTDFKSILDRANDN